jgi:N-acetylmuramoyl-L-alanine amidase
MNTIKFPNNRFALSLRMGFALLLLMFAQWIAASQPELMAIRLGQTPDQTRVVFELKHNQQYQVTRLSDPERIIVDFMGAKNSVSFRNQAFQDKRISGIRVSSDDQRTRVVLDLRAAHQFKYFTLGQNANRPERLVIDLTAPLLAQTKPSEANTQTASISIQQKPSQLAQVDAQPPSSVTGTSQNSVNRPAAASPALAETPAAKPRVAVVNQPAQAGGTRLPTHSATETLLNNNRDFTPKKEFVIAIDPGHGGRDSGAVGPSGVLEKDVVLEISLELKKTIDRTPGMRAVLTRDRDVYLGLNERVKIARDNKADLFISVHADAYTSAAPRGGSVYVLSNSGASSVMARTLAQRENAALGVVNLAGRDQDVAFVLSDLTREANIRASRKLGSVVLAEMQRSMSVHKHTVQSAEFAVLRSIDMPSMLIEAAFISNPHEEQKLKDPRFQTTFAQTITRGLQKFIEQSGHAPRWGETLFVNYQVKPGDTLSHLALAYGVDADELMRFNNLANPNQLFVGRRIRIPVTEKLTLQYELKYRVKPGDTLSQIALAHKVEVQELMKVNNITNANQLRVGRELTIPVREKVLAALN